MVDSDFDRPATAILSDITTASRKIAGPSSQWSSVAAPFSELLVKLSRDAEATAAAVNAKTQTLINLTRFLIGLTFLLILLTAPLVWVDVFGKKSEGMINLQQHDSHRTQNYNDSETTKPPEIAPSNPVKP